MRAMDVRNKGKEPFTNNRMEEYASNGTYYFKKRFVCKKILFQSN